MTEKQPELDGTDGPVRTGGCRCEGVRYAVDGPMRDIWYCHCEDCQRITGHHMAATSADRSAVSFECSETLTWYSAQPGVQYGFCTRCGSTLFWRAADKPERLSICAGTVDQPTRLTTAGVLYNQNKADYIVTTPPVETFAEERIG